MEDNPYRASAEVEADIPPNPAPDAAPFATEEVIGQSGSGRFLAAQIDHTFAVVLFLFVGMNSAASIGNIAAGIVAFAAYLGYYFVPEWVFGTTMGKSLFYLRVQQISGKPCTARQAAIRTLLRLLEVNPLLLGAIPAGIAVYSSKRKQRIGDWLAGTIVVRRNDGRFANAPRPIRVIRRTNKSSVE